MMRKQRAGVATILFCFAFGVRAMSQTPTASVIPTPSATPVPSATPTPSAIPTPSATPTPSAVPTASPTPTPGVTPTPGTSPTPTPSPGESGNTLLNISTRAHAATGENVLIGGFIIGGEVGTAKTVIVRALGPSLLAQGVSNALADPSLQLFGSGGQLIASNDNWQEGTQAEAISESQLAPPDPNEAAIIADLAPGSYTAIVTGVETAQNIALVEVFDLDSLGAAQLLNISTRAFVDTADGVMIAGLIVGGTEDETVVIRGLGPSLANGAAPIASPLTDPFLTLVDENGSALASNQDWQDSQEAEITAAGLALPDPKESGILISLPPGNYTALLADATGGSGVGLVEIYNVTNN